MERGKMTEIVLPVLIVLALSGPGWADPVIVPDVVEMTEGDANTVITAVGLTVGELSYEYSDSTAADLVISQNPVAGAAVPAGSSIDLVVSLGPDGMPEGNGLVSHWKFDEGTGSTAYDSAGDKDGTV
ncbi:MAG: PASTA domain-containing protein, partial [Planctomycetota bacterium]